jgi:hypothetical protein
MSTFTIDYFIDRVGIDMRENHDWVDNSLERRWGTTQYNAAFQEYLDTMEPLSLNDLLVDEGYVSYSTPFFGLAYDFEMEADIVSQDFHYYENDSYEISDCFYRSIDYNDTQDNNIMVDILRE